MWKVDKSIYIYITMMDEVIKNLVKQAEAENWDEIDKEIPNIVMNKDYVNWAYSTALSYTNGKCQRPRREHS